MKRSSVLAALALLAAIVVGFALGYAFGARPRPQRMKQMTLLGMPRSVLLDSLNLTRPQRQRVDSILTAAATRADRSIDGMYLDVVQATQEAHKSVYGTLDLPQRAKLDSILKTVTELKPRSPLPPRTTRKSSR